MSNISVYSLITKGIYLFYTFNLHILPRVEFSICREYYLDFVIELA